MIDHEVCSGDGHGCLCRGQHNHDYKSLGCAVASCAGIPARPRGCGSFLGSAPAPRNLCCGGATRIGRRRRWVRPAGGRGGAGIYMHMHAGFRRSGGFAIRRRLAAAPIARASELLCARTRAHSQRARFRCCPCPPPWWHMHVRIYTRTPQAHSRPAACPQSPRIEHPDREY